MGRKRQPDRAWHWWNSSETRWEIVTVRGGRRHCSLCLVGTSEEGAARAAAIIVADLDTGALSAPETRDDAADAFLEAARTGEHRARPKRGGRRPLRESTRDWYRFRLREAGRVISRLRPDIDPLTLSASDGTRFVEARARETTSTGKPISAATIVAEVEAVTILQRWFVLRKWIERATWEDVGRPEVVSSREPLQPDQVGAFLRAATKLGADPRATTDWTARKAARAAGKKAPRKSEQRREDWERWPAAVWLLMHGLRTEEAAHLLVGDIDPKAGCVRVVDRIGARTKTRASARTVPIMSEEALAVLVSTFAARGPEERAFDTGRGKGAIASGRTQWFLRRCHETCEVAGIRRCSVHELRHTIATAAIAAGADMASVQALLGHEDAKTTARIYAHAQGGSLARAAAGIVGSFLDRMFRARAVD